MSAPLAPILAMGLFGLIGGKRAKPLILHIDDSYLVLMTMQAMLSGLGFDSVQAFGGRGELQNINRAVNKGIVSYLIWDLKDSQGQLAGNGVYVWKVTFMFKGGKQEVQYTRTGLMRKK